MKTALTSVYTAVGLSLAFGFGFLACRPTPPPTVAPTAEEQENTKALRLAADATRLDALRREMRHQMERGDAKAGEQFSYDDDLKKEEHQATRDLRDAAKKESLSHFAEALRLQKEIQGITGKPEPLK